MGRPVCQEAGGGHRTSVSRVADGRAPGGQPERGIFRASIAETDLHLFEVEGIPWGDLTSLAAVRPMGTMEGRRWFLAYDPIDNHIEHSDNPLRVIGQ